MPTHQPFPQWDNDLFLYLNGKNNEALDPIMYAISTYLAWALIFILIITIMIWQNKYWGKRAALFLVGGLCLNSITNQIVKFIVMRPRPINTPQITNLVHHLGTHDHHFSFFSAHASNSLCLALFTTLYFKNKYYAILILVWAVVVAYSRIYVGMHYPTDVAVGAIFGLLTGWLAHWSYTKYYKTKTTPQK